jgi:hypothetical protein
MPSSSAVRTITLDRSLNSRPAAKPASATSMKAARTSANAYASEHINELSSGLGQLRCSMV